MIPDLSVIWVILIVLLFAALLDRLLFRPVTRVMREREMAIKSARELAETSATRAQQALAEFESRTSLARAEVYREMDEKRRVALERRGQVLAATRQQAEALVGEATARLRSQAAEARARLQRESESLAAAVVERVLGRRAS